MLFRAALVAVVIPAETSPAIRPSCSSLTSRWCSGARSQDDDFLVGAHILVKHTEDYEADNPDRTDDYVGEGTSVE